MKQKGRFIRLCVRPVLLCYFRPVLLCYCEMWKLTVADKARLHRVKLHMIRIGYGVRLVNRVLTDVLWNEVGVIVKIEDIIMQSCLVMQSFPYENHGECYKKLVARSWPMLFTLKIFFFYIHSSLLWQKRSFP